ncbi:unnamed protein product [Brachionus calyciflorus]|uniref:TIR domain-containing protein n=1 Tax=Brachionus calyciflorus TaxID=104777 RepID=A0A813M465_9BILA|nr:unnamed protein product [Brachionus calyciflorus]
MGDKNSKPVADDDSNSIDWNSRLQIDIAELEKKKRKHKKDHPSIANCLSKIASDYKHLGDFEKALKFESESLEILKNLYPDQTHLAIAKSYNFISGCYSMLGKYNKSLENSLESYDVYQRFYKKPHSSTAQQLNNISTCYKNVNDLNNALLYASNCLKMRQEIHKNEDHIDLAYSYSDIGFIYSQLGYVDKGIKFSTKALEIYGNLKTEYIHPDLAYLYNNLAMDYRNLGAHEKSFYYLKKFLEVIFKLYSGNCVEIANALQSAAVGYRNLDDYSNCLKYNLISVKVYEKLDSDLVSKKYDSEIAELYSTIALCYFYLNEREECLKYSLKSLEYYEKILKAKDAKIARLKNNISIAYGNLGDTKRALQYAQESLRIYKELYDGDHVDIARALANVGSAYGNLGDAFFGLKYSVQALEMFKKLYSGDHYDVAYALYNVACSYDDLGDRNNFLNFTLRSLKMHQDLVNGRDSLDTILLLKNTGLAYSKLNNAINALKYAKDALKMAKNLFKEPHPLIAICLFCIAKSYKASGDKNLEHENLLKALEMKYILKKLFGFEIFFDSPTEKFRFDEKQFRYKLKKKPEEGSIPEPKKHIMLSYYGDIRNRHECMETKEILDSKEYRIYVDLSTNHGKSYDQMTNAVDNSTIVIILLNEEYIKNDYCKLEAAYAIKQKKKIIPIVIDMESKHVKDWLDSYRFEMNQCIDFTKYDFDEYAKVLLNDVEVKLSIILTNDSLNDLNSLEEKLRENQVNSNLISKLKSYDFETMRSLSKLDTSMLQHVLMYLRQEPNEFTNEDILRLKACLNQTFV